VLLPFTPQYTPHDLLAKIQDTLTKYNSYAFELCIGYTRLPLSL
jgi:hypothetical protein